jgi:hypoxanthine phosphoribosyltransferase
VSDYHQQLQCSPSAIDLAFWREPEGVEVPDDELRFLLVPDAVEAAACVELARQVHQYQDECSDPVDKITRALIVTMGGMLPGVLLHDYLVHGRHADDPAIEFGTVGVSLYEGPGVRHETPRVEREVSIDVEGHTILLVDDLGDTGGTLDFIDRMLRESGARETKKLVVYMKPAALPNGAADFCFGNISQDTWLITPREQIETLAQRVPLWRERGANLFECRGRLVELIGYPPALVDYYLPRLFS